MIRPIPVMMIAAAGGTDREEKAEVATMTQAVQLSTGISAAEKTRGGSPFA
jgi:hypothetical protein